MDENTSTPEHDAEVITPNTFFGACGVAGCTRCRPLFDAHNDPIPNT